jgi:hypothetical protein
MCWDRMDLEVARDEWRVASGEKRRAAKADPSRHGGQAPAFAECGRPGLPAGRFGMTGKARREAGGDKLRPYKGKTMGRMAGAVILCVKRTFLEMNLWRNELSSRTITSCG